MTLRGRTFFRLASIATVLLAAPACAQESLDRGKSPQQIFASDCSGCHKTPQGLAKSGGLFGLQGFLREHYTVSRETASMMARYLESVGDAPAADQRRQPRRATKLSEPKSGGAKPAQAKSETAKPESRPEPTAEAKPETKPASNPEPKASTEIKSGIAVTPAATEKPKSE